MEQISSNQTQVMFSRKNLEERSFWKQFLAVYKQYPEIWDPRCEKYSKRDYKEVAYQALAQKLKELDPYASTDCVKRRLNIFKSNYKRELRRREKTGTKGNLWYFDDLDFLIDIDKISRVRKTDKSDSSDFDMSEIQTSVSIKNEHIDLGPTLIDKNYMSHYNENVPHAYHQERNDFSLRIQSLGQNCNEPIQPQTPVPQSNFHENASFQDLEPKVNEDSLQEDSYNEEDDHDKFHQSEASQEKPPQLLSQNASSPDDDAEVYSRSWATTFRKIPANQQQLAKKLIDDILYEGYMGRLAEGKVQIVN
ncbi:hypothetical protein ACFFRR_007445 [Megaselia abdita]